MSVVVDFLKAATRRGLLHYDINALKHAHAELWAICCPDEPYPELDTMRSSEIIDEIMDLQDRVP